MKNLLFTYTKGFRYERKFFIEELTREEVESIIKLHPAIFREIYQERTVNNIYFDSFNLQHYFDNINGVDRRLKVRIRWYGDLFGFVENPALELKIKHNLHVSKLLYSLKSFILDDNFSIDIIRKALKETSLPDSLKLHLAELDFSLLNSYNRKYFLSSDRKYRLTTDSDMKVYKLLPYKNNFLDNTIDSTNIILELKYNMLQDKFVDIITNYFPFRITRNSKYVEGIRKIYA